MATEIVQQKVRKTAAYKGMKQKEWEGFIRRRREKGFMGAAKFFLASRATKKKIVAERVRKFEPYLKSHN